jgi:hypothetical protein
LQLLQKTLYTLVAAVAEDTLVAAVAEDTLVAAVAEDTLVATSAPLSSYELLAADMLS